MDSFALSACQAQYNGLTRNKEKRSEVKIPGWKFFTALGLGLVILGFAVSYFIQLSDKPKLAPDMAPDPITINLNLNLPGINPKPPPAPSGSTQPGALDEYKIILAVDKELEIPGRPGLLKVWIGSPDYQATFPSTMTQDKTTVPAVGETAEVEPVAPDFDINPEETQCIEIHPSGSEVQFVLTPKKEKSGKFDVSANVRLYHSLDCSGSPIPKTSARLTVSIKVNYKELFIEKLMELGSVTWDKFLEFWGALVALVFALILYLRIAIIY